jgi:hypothetical protein
MSDSTVGVVPYGMYNRLLRFGLSIGKHFWWTFGLLEATWSLFDVSERSESEDVRPNS